MRKTGIAVCFALVGCAAACSTESEAPEGTAAVTDDTAHQDAPEASKREAITAAVARQDAARKATASDPVGARAVTRLHGMRAALGIDAKHTFTVASVNADARGVKHVRFDQHFEGVRVLGSTVISHVGLDGQSDGDDQTDSLRRGIGIRTVPRLDTKDILGRVAAHPEHRGAYLADPRAELVILPVVERFVKATGERVTGAEQGLDALDIENRVTSYRLVYQVDTLESGEGAPTRSIRYRLDADSGEVLEARSLAKSNANFGKAFATRTAANGGVVPITTTNSSNLPTVLSNPRSASRNFGVWDDDFCQGCGPNVFFTMNGAALNGDGLAFAGDDAASENNRRTAVVDVLYGMQVTWDMFATVFGRAGYDGAHYQGDAYVHSSTDWDDAHYTNWTGNIEVGDGPPTARSNRTTLDTIAHEFTHGVVDFTAQLDGTSEGDGLNEAFGDIFAEVAEAWEAGKGQPNALSVIPASPGADFFSRGSNRDLVRPNGPRYWTPALAGMADPHDRALPLDHAFFYLSQGATSDPGQPDEKTNLRTSFSRFLPWGMSGIGIDAAARIFNLALVGFMGSDTDYAGARQACNQAAAALFGANSVQAKAVANAFAAIGVGAPAASYPTIPAMIAEPGANDVMVDAPAIVPASLPAGAPQADSLFKRVTVAGSVSTADKDDFYFVYVPAGKQLRATVMPSIADADVFLWQASVIDKSEHVGAQEDQVYWPARPEGHAYYIQVHHYGTLSGVPASTVAPYRLDVDLF